MKGVITREGELHKGLVQRIEDKFGIFLYLYHPGEDYNFPNRKQFSQLHFDIEDSCEPFLVYQYEPGKGFFYRDNVWTPQLVKEELPAWIGTKEKLLEVIEFLYSEDPSSW